MEKNNISKKALLVVFVFALFMSSAYSVDVIDMRNQIDVSKNEITIKETKMENQELLLYNNYIDTISNQEFVKLIAPYYNSMVFTIDGYNLTVQFNDYGIDKIIDGSVDDADLYVNVSEENVKYLVNNWYSINTFEKIKYVINLDGVPLGEVIKLSGIAMSLISEK